MDVIRPTALDGALAARASHPGAVPICGGTDLMVELNFDRRRPDVVIDLGHVAELREWGSDGDSIRLGAAVTYTRVITELGQRLPGLAMASRTVGSPPIRNRGTVGGNLGSASPAGDSHPPLLAAGAEIELASQRGTRRIPIDAFYVGPKRSVLADDELVVAVHLPPVRGSEQFAKVGPRNAMVIAVCSFAVSLDPVARRVGTGIGSAGPTPLQAPEAEQFLAAALGEVGWNGSPLSEATKARFGELVAAAARPIDDVRGSAAYRRHALAVVARRTLGWALEGMARAA